MRIHELSQTITSLIKSLEIPETNDADLQTMLYGFAIYSVLNNAAKKFKHYEENIKEENKEKLLEPVEKFLLNTIPEIQVYAKVNSPRKTFNKEEFIKAVSDTFDISAFQLLEITQNCEKASVAPISLTCEITNVVSSA